MSLRTTDRDAFDSAVRKRYASRAAAASPRTSIGAGQKQPEDEKTPLEEFAYGSERIAAGALGAAEGVTDAIGSTFYKGVDVLADLAKSTPLYQNWVAKDGDRDETSWLTKLSDFAEKKAESFLDNSVTRDYKESIEKRYQPTEIMKTVGGINELGGQILSSIATGKGLGTLVKAGADALDAAADTSKWARGVNALSAGGNAASQAKAEGADTNRALLYGGVTAAVNQGTERLFGGIPGLGEGKVTKALGGLPGVSKAVDVVGEGVENALGTAIDPFLKRATYSKNAQPATPKEIGQSALMGMATSTAFQLPSMIDDIAAQYTKGLNSIRQKMAMDDLAAVYEKNVGPIEAETNLDEPVAVGYDKFNEGLKASLSGNELSTETKPLSDEIGKKPYASSRPGYGVGQVEQVWEQSKESTTGKVYDPSGVEITWDTTKPRNGQWDMGHIPGRKYADMHQLYMNGVISKEEFLDWYRNPDNYRPELPSTNRSHKYE